MRFRSTIPLPKWVKSNSATRNGALSSCCTVSISRGNKANALLGKRPIIAVSTFTCIPTGVPTYEFSCGLKTFAFKIADEVLGAINNKILAEIRKNPRSFQAFTL